MFAFGEAIVVPEVNEGHLYLGAVILRRTTANVLPT